MLREVLSMSHDFSGYTAQELQSLIDAATKTLKEKQESERREYLRQMNELASKAGVKFQIVEDLSKGAAAPSTRRGAKVPAKYQNPHNPAEKWSGRGVKPRWLQALVAQGRDIKEFEIKA
ncbi:H-NS histone family protein [Methylococcus sp. ANG]|uniref:H-NS histone family protein n=1 Tax=Methylococcus sp. ANG TaxID=3231903 RepID=UPI003457595C